MLTDHLEDLVVDGRIILKWIFRKLDEDARAVAWDSDRRRAFVNAVMNLRVP